MEDTLTVASVMGGLAPLAIAVINRPGWSSQRKQLVAIAASVVLAVVALAVTGGFADFDPADWLATVTLVIGTSQAAYALIWKPTDTAPAIERKVNHGEVDLAA